MGQRSTWPGLDPGSSAPCCLGGSRASLYFRPTVGEMGRLDFITCKGPCTAACESNKPLGSLPRVTGEGAGPGSLSQQGCGDRAGDGDSSVFPKPLLKAQRNLLSLPEREPCSYRASDKRLEVKANNKKERQKKKKDAGAQWRGWGLGVGVRVTSLLPGPRPRTDVDTEGSASQMPSLPQSARVLSECPLVKSFGLTISRFWSKAKCTIILGSCGTMINAQLPQHTVNTHVPTGNQTHALPVATMTCGRSTLSHLAHPQQGCQAFLSTFSNLPRSFCNRCCLFYG